MLILQNKNLQNGKLCNYTITNDDGELNNFWKSGGQERVQQLYYKCASAEVCCGLECCSSGTATITNTVITETSHRDQNGTLIKERTSNTTTLIKQIDQVKHPGVLVQEKHRSAAATNAVHPAVIFVFAMFTFRAVVE
jgi:hypothetical protein